MASGHVRVQRTPSAELEIAHTPKAASLSTDVLCAMSAPGHAFGSERL